jgi:hypothetical protein
MAVVLILTSGVGLAHDRPGSTEFVAPLPTDNYTGKILTATLIGPTNDSHVLHATLAVTWNSHPNMPASDLGLEFTLPTVNGSEHWIVTGADLGFGDGPGTFTATLDSDDLNGIVFWPLPPNAIIHFDIFNATGTDGVWGQFQNSSLTLEIEGEAPDPSGSVPDGSEVPGPPLTVAKALNNRIELSWADSCGADSDFEIYEGELNGDFANHVPRFCSTGGSPVKMFVPIESSAYYLVVPTNGTVEGSYGVDGDGAERPPGAAACLAQFVGACG